MFTRLQQKWKVGGLRLFLILVTFAVGGSATGFVAKKIMNALPIGADWVWAVVYILLVTILWPLSVLLVSLPLGQFGFFVNYIRRLGGKLGLVKSTKGLTGSMDHPVNIAIFASGAGSNAQKIIDHFRHHPDIRVALIICNKPGAGVLSIAANEGIPSLVIDRQRFFSPSSCLPELTERKIGFVVLAGFLWKIPTPLIQAFPGRIVNIHPALLPRFGGKGMFGHHVHEAVIAAGEKESGITIHRVDEIYDHGAIVFQARCPVLPSDSPESLAQRIHQLEHAHFPGIIEKMIMELQAT